ncbi:MAG: divalent-cation tolerance protein CutA [Methanobacteriota archaeon]|nr:MAG: divalent-cation tolerance protein CutA [Euryarchaeota archaeon]|tara:strand:+ start:46 stop:348 length:303 start_codon:yes stop_codon:yes gene_type:complete
MFLIKTTLPISFREFEVTSFAQSIVESGAACVQHREISSTYSWDGKLNHEKEWLLEIKVSEKNKESVQEVITNLHPYDVPEILILKVEANQEYLDWVNSH